MTIVVAGISQLRGMTMIAMQSKSVFMTWLVTPYGHTHERINGKLHLLYMDTRLHTYLLTVFPKGFYFTPIHTYAEARDTTFAWLSLRTTMTKMNTHVLPVSCHLFSFQPGGYQHRMGTIMECMPLFIQLVITCHGKTWTSLLCYHFA